MKGLPPLPLSTVITWHELIQERIDEGFNEEWPSLSELARRVGVTKSCLDFYRTGKRIPTAPNLLALVKVLWPKDSQRMLYKLSNMMILDKAKNN